MLKLNQSPTMQRGRRGKFDLKAPEDSLLKVKSSIQVILQHRVMIKNCLVVKIIAQLHLCILTLENFEPKSECIFVTIAHFPFVQT
jgi:hypothetical protein